MRKYIIIIIGCILTIFLASCTKNEELIITPETIIDMSNLDLYMERDDVQYVDLRNFHASFKSGYIDGFEKIPFFDFLDYRAFDRGRSYDFNPDQLRDTDLLLRLFKSEKAILLYADGCIRSGYLKDVLNYLGYERVYVIGGFYEYEGSYVIEGSNDYEFGDSFYNTYLDESTGITYMMSGKFDVARNINSIRFDIVDEDGSTFRGNGYDSNIDYNYMLTIIEEHIFNSIYNFNELYEELDTPGSEINELENVNWELFEDFMYVIAQQYID